jgi:hypothetical protein
MPAGQTVAEVRSRSLSDPPTYRPAYLDLIEEHLRAASRHRRNALVIQLVPLALAVVLCVILLAALPGGQALYLVIGILALGLVAVAASRSSGRLLRRMGARPERPGEMVRVHNMLQQLALTVGVARPEVVVVDHPAVEVMVVGTSERNAHLVVTSATPALLDVVELEALLAHALVRLKDLAMLPGVVATGWLVPLARVLPAPAAWLWARLGPEGPEEVDYRTVRLTRYPPGLRSALESVVSSRQSSGSNLPGGGALAHLWTVFDSTSPLPPPKASATTRCSILDEI